MSKLLHLLSLATLSAVAATCPAQDSTYQTQAPAPVERSAPSYNQSQPAAPTPLTFRPAEGITVRSTTQIKTVASDAGKVELRLEHGLANVTLRHPAHNTLIQIDLPGGEVSLMKDGLYTFNADTGTVRVLTGEAEGYTRAAPDKGIPIKGEHELNFSGSNPQAAEFNPEDARADLLGHPAESDYGAYGGGNQRGYRPYGYSGYYGYGYPYYAVSPYSYWGYPYGGYGYPGIGIGVGFGYYGGFGGYRGGFGGFRGGFGGRRFR